MTPISLTCEQFQTLLEQDPYCWTTEIQSHRASCASCRIAHVLLLAEADPPAHLTDTAKPDHYFQELAMRVVRQLPPSPPQLHRSLPMADWRSWLAPAAALLLVTFGLQVLEPVGLGQGHEDASLVVTSLEAPTLLEESLSSDPFSPDWLPTEFDLTHSDELSTFLYYFDSKEVEAIWAELDLTDLTDFDLP